MQIQPDNSDIETQRVASCGYQHINGPHSTSEFGHLFEFFKRSPWKITQSVACRSSFSSESPIARLRCQALGTSKVLLGTLFMDIKAENVLGCGMASKEIEVYNYLHV
ncbi:hypothetical protein ABKN59_011935 [Abortiporus biennis]